MDTREYYVIKVDLPQNTSRRECRIIIQGMQEWCKQNLKNDVSVWYTTTSPTKHSIWRLFCRDDAVLFRLKFGGSICDL